MVALVTNQRCLYPSQLPTCIGQANCDGLMVHTHASVDACYISNLGRKTLIHPMNTTICNKRPRLLLQIHHNKSIYNKCTQAQAWTLATFFNTGKHGCLLYMSIRKFFGTRKFRIIKKTSIR